MCQCSCILFWLSTSPYWSWHKGCVRALDVACHISKEFQNQHIFPQSTGKQLTVQRDSQRTELVQMKFLSILWYTASVFRSGRTERFERCHIWDESSSLSSFFYASTFSLQLLVNIFIPNTDAHAVIVSRMTVRRSLWTVPFELL